MQLGFNLSNGVSDNTLVQFNTDLFGDTQSIYTQLSGEMSSLIKWLIKDGGIVNLHFCE